MVDNFHYFNDFERVQARSNILTIADIPEISCSKGGIKEKCVDMLKLIAFKNLAERNKEFSNKLGNLNVSFYLVYPKPMNYKECNKDNLQECSYWNVYFKKPSQVTSKIIEKTPISLYDPVTDTNYIGVMIVEAYNV